MTIMYRNGDSTRFFSSPTFVYSDGRLLYVLPAGAQYVVRIPLSLIAELLA